MTKRVYQRSANGMVRTTRLPVIDGVICDCNCKPLTPTADKVVLCGLPDTHATIFLTDSGAEIMVPTE